jgi:DNA-binding XRE family transcriptional regulator
MITEFAKCEILEVVNIKKTLADIRNDCGYTQEQMSNFLDIAVSTYNQYEKGTRNVPKIIANRTAEILNVPIDEIFLPTRFTVSKTK